MTFVPPDADPVGVVDLARIEAARRQLRGRVHETPTLTSTSAAEAIAAATGCRLAEGRLLARADHLQKTGLTWGPGGTGVTARPSLGGAAFEPLEDGAIGG